MLKELHLTNFWCHRDFKTEFKLGINCIVAGNGKGKTTLLSALYSALTNSYEHPEGLKGSIRQGAESARIEAVFSDFTIVREIAEKTKHLLTVGDETFKAVKDIETELANRFGFVKSILDKFVFIRQGRFADIISMSDSDRAKTLAYLSNVEYFELLWKKLAEEMKLHETALKNTPTFDEHTVAAQIDSLTEELRNAQEKHKIAAASLAAIDKAEANAKLTLATELKTTQSLVAAWQVDLLRLQNEIQAAEDVRKKYEYEFTAAQHALTCVALLNHEVIELSEYTAYQANAKAIAEMQAEWTQLSAEVDGSDSAQLRQDNLAMTQQVQTFAERLSKLKMQLRIAENTAQNKPCEVCGALPEAQFKGNPTIISNTLNKIVSEKEELEQKINTNLQIIHQNETKAERILELEKKLEELKANKPFETEEYYEKLNSRYQQQVELLPKVEQARFNLGVAENNKQNIIDSYERTNFQLEKSKQLTQNEETITREAAQAQKTLDKISELTIEIVTYDTILKEKQNHLDSLKDLLKQVKEKKKQKKLKKYIDLLEEVRSLTHRNNIPHVISKRFLYQLIGQINSYLTQFDAPFKAMVGENLEFRAEMNSGAMVPATALSGGQKCLLAMAFWLAVFQSNAGSTGLLVLDEPGEGLDEANRKNFNHIFQQVDEIFKRQGQQLLLISHDISLTDNFYTISL